MSLELTCWWWHPSTDIGKNHQVRRQYTVQHGENEMVQKVLNSFYAYSECGLIFRMVV